MRTLSQLAQPLLHVRKQQPGTPEPLAQSFDARSESGCATGHTDRPSSPLDLVLMIDLNIVSLYLVTARKARDTFQRSRPR